MSFYGQYTGFGGGGVSINKSLIEILTDLSLTTNLKLVLDAGDSVSYTSGEDWIDRSGNLGGDEFHLGSGTGADSNDPTFNGTAGGLSENEYFSFDGGDYFTYGAANETWMTAMHKASFKNTIALWMKVGTDVTGTNHGIFGNMSNVETNVGMRFLREGLHLYWEVANGSDRVADTSADNISAGWQFLAVSVHEDGGSSAGIFVINGVSETFDPNITPSTSAATYVTQIGANGNGQLPVASADLFAGIAVWQGTNLSAADLNSLYNASKGRFV